MATIVQNYGPIYGEVVNGTVQGRPNGSVYVPISNTISIDLRVQSRYLSHASGTTLYRFCKSDGTSVTSDGLTFVAESQDLSSNVEVSIYSDAELTTRISSRAFAAGMFNNQFRDTYNGTAPYPDLVSAATYYVRAQLMNNGTAVATSSVIEVVAL